MVQEARVRVMVQEARVCAEMVSGCSCGYKGEINFVALEGVESNQRCGNVGCL